MKLLCIEEILQDPFAAKARLTIDCNEKGEFTGAIIQDGKTIAKSGKPKPNIANVLLDLEETCSKIITE